MLSECVEEINNLEIILNTNNKEYFLRRAQEFIESSLKNYTIIDLDKAILLLGMTKYLIKKNNVQKE